MSPDQVLIWIFIYSALSFLGSGGIKFFMNNTLTLENIKKLREELEYRMTVKRAEIAKEKQEAAAL